MGGGYLYKADADVDALCKAVAAVKRHNGVDVYVEPGATMVRESGFIVSSVIDIFENDGKTIAILDTTVNHMPEVYEYQFEPDVLDHSDEGEFEYTLAGSSCLAGDIFGNYAFDEPLQVGSRVVFANQGAYTFVKAHMFNGINLPSIYARTPDAQFVLKRRFTYSDFTSRFGGTPA
jgi:carboxynorspermidine decarboxylase